MRKIKGFDKKMNPQELATKTSEELAFLKQRAEINKAQSEFELSQLSARAEVATKEKQLELASIPGKLVTDTQNKTAQLALITSNLQNIQAAIDALPE